MKKKSKAKTPKAAVSIADFRPSREAANTTATKYIMTILVGERNGATRRESSVAPETSAKLAMKSNQGTAFSGLNT